MVIMVIMERERLRLNQVITTMGIPIMVDMVTMDIMAREKLRLSLLLSLVTTIMDILIMEAMVIMDIMARGRQRQSQDTITMAMVIMVNQATIYLFKNFSKLKRVPLNLVKRNT